MASPLSHLIRSNDQYYGYYQHHQTPQHPTMPALGSASAKPQPISAPAPTPTAAATTTTNRVKKPASRRNPSSSSSRKKTPQRGMGVAQLERLRAQAELARKCQQPPPLNLNHPPAIAPVPVLNPIDSVPVQYGSVNYGVPVIGVPGWWSPDQGWVVQKPENVGYYGFNNMINGGGFGSGHNHHQVMGNRYNMVGAPVQYGHATAAFETSKELTSMPKAMQQCSPTNCHTCMKKKRFQGEAKGQIGMKEKHVAALNCSDSFIRSNQGHYKTNNYNAGFSSIGSRTAFYGNHQSKECTTTTTAEVVAVHRKGDSYANAVVGRGVFMEYEFFPDHKNGKSSSTSTTTCFKDQMEVDEFPAAGESSVAVMEFPATAASCITTTTASDHPYNTGYYNPYYNNDNSYSASNSIDLSLKLSF